MGKVLSSLFSEKDKDLNIIIDFENAKPTEKAEIEVYEDIAKYLQSTEVLLTEVGNFKGCDALIKASISNSSPDAEEQCWRALLPSVDILKTFFDFSEDLTQIIPKLLNVLFSGDQSQNLATQQALAKQLADVLAFVLRFDDAKMQNPAIQNDFSYYRRTLNRMKTQKKNLDILIKDELANRMSLFFAYPTPMMNVINGTTAKFLASHPAVPRENVTSALQIMANICEEMVREKKFASEQTNMFCLRCMVGAIILYDHVDAIGAFGKKSPINMRGCITALKDYKGTSGHAGLTDGLLNALRFTTVHLNDPETPASIKHLLD